MVEDQLYQVLMLQEMQVQIVLFLLLLQQVVDMDQLIQLLVVEMVVQAVEQEHQ